MDKTQIYDFAGIITPGAVSLYALSRIYPQIGLLTGDEKISFGEFGLLLILAYVAGHLIQAIGNAIESVYWRCLGGVPSDWVQNGAHYLIAPQQISRVPLQIREVLKLNCPDDLKELRRTDWFSITRQIYAAVKQAGQSERIDIFNGRYGMLRGVAASLIVVMIAAINKSAPWPLYIVLLILVFLSLYRMHRFGVHYARELFLQFLTINPTKDGQTQTEQPK